MFFVPEWVLAALKPQDLVLIEDVATHFDDAVTSCEGTVIVDKRKIRETLVQASFNKSAWPLLDASIRAFSRLVPPSTTLNNDARVPAQAALRVTAAFLLEQQGVSTATIQSHMPGALNTRVSRVSLAATPVSRPVMVSGDLLRIGTSIPMPLRPQPRARR